jgi:hypothetical protein
MRSSGICQKLRGVAQELLVLVNKNERQNELKVDILILNI